MGHTLPIDSNMRCVTQDTVGWFVNGELTNQVNSKFIVANNKR